MSLMVTIINKIKIQVVNRRADRLSQFFSQSGANSEFLANIRDLSCSPRVWSNWVSYFEQLNFHLGIGVHKQSSQDCFTLHTKAVWLLSYPPDRDRKNVLFRCSESRHLGVEPSATSCSPCPIPSMKSMSYPRTSKSWVWALQSWHNVPFQCCLPALTSVHTPSDVFRKLSSLNLEHHSLSQSAPLCWWCNPLLSCPHHSLNFVKPHSPKIPLSTTSSTNFLYIFFCFRVHI